MNCYNYVIERPKTGRSRRAILHLLDHVGYKVCRCRINEEEHEQHIGHVLPDFGAHVQPCPMSRREIELAEQETA